MVAQASRGATRRTAGRLTGSVRIQGEEVIVKAVIHTLGGFSAHASQEQLLDWTTAFNQPRPQTCLIHGEETAKDVLRKQLQGRDWNVGIPRFAETVSF